VLTAAAPPSMTAGHRAVTTGHHISHRRRREKIGERRELRFSKRNKREKGYRKMKGISPTTYLYSCRILCTRGYTATVRPQVQAV